MLNKIMILPLVLILSACSNNMNTKPKKVKTIITQNDFIDSGYENTAGLHRFSFNRFAVRSPSSYSLSN